MGCTSSNQTKSPLPHLVIAGFQYGGYNLLHQVKDKFRVTVIDKKDFFEWTPAGPTNMSKEGNFEMISENYHNAINTNKVFGSNVNFKQGLVTELVDNHNLKYVPTRKSKTTSQTAAEKNVTFNYLAICTGSIWSANHDLKDVLSIYSKEDKSKYFAQYREQIDNAKSILIVGGGPTGLESTSASKLIEAYGEKASEMAKDHFEAKNVDLHFNTMFDSSHELAKEYDFVLNCVGTRVATPFMDKHYSDFKGDRGHIFVNEFHQVTNVNPLTGKSSGSTEVLDNVFAFGDCSLSKLNETKNVPAATVGALTVANNLIQSIDGDKKDFRTIPEHNFFISGVYFDDTAGVIVMGPDTIMNPKLYEEKKGYFPPYISFLRNEADSQKKYNDYITMFKS
ncbi:unnamed protein product [Moneuplotes crassus]|uniref:FAD/NAD(P)-binding domain-containing protein n=1 Tax=Euplotes crassus TaxID=5936 RepID=A0AAD1XE34_EUPCR|nr:unnamed protein product [Moneuplotes crassus]